MKEGWDGEGGMRFGREVVLAGGGGEGCQVGEEGLTSKWGGEGFEVRGGCRTK